MISVVGVPVNCPQYHIYTTPFEPTFIGEFAVATKHASGLFWFVPKVMVMLLSHVVAQKL